uniref:SH3 domain-containing protein n=1 Tax=Strongyloides papillosus TaxID=174720 RepID=A0A0N5B5T0_STREA
MEDITSTDIDEYGAPIRRFEKKVRFTNLQSSEGIRKRFNSPYRPIEKEVLYNDLSKRQVVSYCATHDVRPYNSDLIIPKGLSIKAYDQGDPNWYWGMAYDGRSVTKTYLPKSSVSPVYKNETIMSVRKNICLSKESMTLYRGQIVFVQNNSLSIDKKLTIRTETNKLVNCRLSFLEFPQKK